MKQYWTPSFILLIGAAAAICFLPVSPPPYGGATSGPNSLREVVMVLLAPVFATFERALWLLDTLAPHGTHVLAPSASAAVPRQVCGESAGEHSRYSTQDCHASLSMTCWEMPRTRSLGFRYLFPIRVIEFRREW